MLPFPPPPNNDSNKMESGSNSGTFNSTRKKKERKERKRKGPKNMGDQSQQQQRLDSIGDYVFERTVGQGQFGKVKLATHKPTGVRVAIKVIHKLSLTPDTLRMVQREVTIMKMLHHPNIIRLYEVIESDTHLFIVMEYAAGGEVMDLIMAHGRLKVSSRFWRRRFLKLFLLFIFKNFKKKKKQQPQNVVCRRKEKRAGFSHRRRGR